MTGKGHDAGNKAANNAKASPPNQQQKLQSIKTENDKAAVQRASRTSTSRFNLELSKDTVAKTTLTRGFKGSRPHVNPVVSVPWRVLRRNMLESCVLWCVGDLLAQLISNYRRLSCGASDTSRRLHGNSSSGEDMSAATLPTNGKDVFVESFRNSSSSSPMDIANSSSPISSDKSSDIIHEIGTGALAMDCLGQHDFSRTAHAALYSTFVFAPAASFWYNAMSHFLPDPRKDLLKRVLFDQLMWAPIILTCYFSCMSVLRDGLDIFPIIKKVESSLVPALQANWLFWVPLQLVNLSLVPQRYWMLTINAAAIPWTCYLASTNENIQEVYEASTFDNSGHNERRVSF